MTHARIVSAALAISSRFAWMNVPARRRKPERARAADGAEKAGRLPGAGGTRKILAPQVISGRSAASGAGSFCQRTTGAHHDKDKENSFDHVFSRRREDR